MAHRSCPVFPHLLVFTDHIIGDVVRIGPNELSFNTPKALKDIYSHATKGQKKFLKSDFYDFAHGRPDIVAARDPVEHAVQRRQLAHAFSTKSLRGQEGIVQGYLDQFVDQMGKLSVEEGGVEVGEAFNWLTFDIIGERIRLFLFILPYKNNKTHVLVRDHR